MSLRTRLLAGMVLVALVLISTAFVVTRATRSYLLDQVDAQLEQAVGPGSLWRSGQRGGPGGGGPFGNGEPRGPLEQFNRYYVATVDPDDTVEVLAVPRRSGRTGSRPVIDVDDARANAESGQAFTTGSDDGDSAYRVFARELQRDGSLLVVAESVDDVDAAVSRLVLVEVLATLAVVAVLSLVTWWVLRLGVRPIKRMTAAASTIAGGDLSHRVPAAAPGTEAGELGTALNLMLGRIESAFDEQAASEERLRRFVADASHELRTPVTTIRGYSELYRHGGLSDPAELDEAMRRTEDEATRMGNLVADMLQLARLDQGRPLGRDLVRLDRLVDDAVRDARVVHPERSIVTECAPTEVIGDDERLRQVVTNLLSNAIGHTPDGSTVSVEVTADGNTARLRVADDGPGMSQADVEHAFERFYRADASRSRAGNTSHAGSGLGLSIVAAIVGAHGGTVGISSELGVGTTVTLELPTRAPPEHA